MKYTQKLKEEFEELPAVNYNLYIGSGKDACDNCLKYEDAVNQILDFFHQAEQEMLKKILELEQTQSSRHDWSISVEQIKSLKDNEDI